MEVFGCKVAGYNCHSLSFGCGGVVFEISPRTAFFVLFAMQSSWHSQAPDRCTSPHDPGSQLQTLKRLSNEV